MPPPATVVDIIVASEAHDTLEAAVIAAMLDDDLAGEGPFTVFAPTDDAFAALADGVLENLLEMPTEELADILLFHVADGSFFSTDLSDGQMLPSLEGESLDISFTTDGVEVEGVMISMTDIMADNGVVHVIDAVMIPRSVNTREPSFAENVKIMPNPATNYIGVRLPQEILGDAELTLRDMSGRTIVQRRASSTFEQIDAASLPGGTYLMEIRARAGVIQRRVVVQR